MHMAKLQMDVTFAEYDDVTIEDLGLNYPCLMARTASHASARKVPAAALGGASYVQLCT